MEKLEEWAVETSVFANETQAMSLMCICGGDDGPSLE